MSLPKRYLTIISRKFLVSRYTNNNYNHSLKDGLAAKKSKSLLFKNILGSSLFSVKAFLRKCLKLFMKRHRSSHELIGRGANYQHTPEARRVQSFYDETITRRLHWRSFLPELIIADEVDVKTWTNNSC